MQLSLKYHLVQATQMPGLMQAWITHVSRSNISEDLSRQKAHSLQKVRRMPPVKLSEGEKNPIFPFNWFFQTLPFQKNKIIPKAHVGMKQSRMLNRQPTSARSLLVISHPPEIPGGKEGGCGNMLQQTEAISEESCHTNGEAEGCLRLQKPLVKRLLFDPHVTARQEQDENVNSKRSPPSSLQQVYYPNWLTALGSKLACLEMWSAPVIFHFMTYFIINNLKNHK